MDNFSKMVEGVKITIEKMKKHQQSYLGT